MDAKNQDQTSEAEEKSQRFVEGEDDTVIDRTKRLVWLKKDTWQLTGKWMNWVQVRDFSERMNRKRYAGYENWRLPTADEAKSLYDKTQSNEDYMGTTVPHPSLFTPGFGFLFWTSQVRNKIQGMRFGYRKGLVIYDDIYRVSRGSTRLVRNIEKEDGLI